MREQKIQKSIDHLQFARRMYIIHKRAGTLAVKYWGDECLRARRELETLLVSPVSLYV